MRVLFITQYFFPENFRLNDLAVGLVAMDCDVTVLTGKPNYPNGNFFSGYSFFGQKISRYEGVTVIRSPIIPRGKNKYMLILNYISFPFFAIICNLKLLLFKKYDIIFVSQLSPILMAFPAIFYKKIHNKPLFLWVTDLWPESLRATGFVKNKLALALVDLIVRFIYKNSDEILISCKGFESSISQRVPHKKSTYFPYWSEELFKPINRDSVATHLLKYSSSKFTITFAGNIGVAQNLETLIEACALLSPLELSQLRVLLIGDGRNISKLRERIIYLGLENIFIFTGSMPLIDMPSMYALSDVLFIGLTNDPIFSITVPSKIQSYMACGKPILGAIDGETSFLIRDSRAGLCSASTDICQLSQNIKIFLNMCKNELQHFGNNALQYHKNHFDRNQSIDRLMKLFMEKNLD